MAEARGQATTVLEVSGVQWATEKNVATPATLVTKENLATVDLSEVTAPADYRP